MVIRVDFHSHTSYSKDSLTMPADLGKSGRQRGLDRIVITDHNSISGALIAQQLDPDLVIVGEEIKTTQGEILAAYVKEAIPPGLTPLETIARLRDQGAFISVSHPFDIRSGAWMEEDLLEIAPLVDAIEVFNARCIKPGANQSAARFAKAQNIPGTAGSDAHASFEIGAAYLELPEFNDVGGLRTVIRQGRVRGRVSPLWVHILSRYARFKKRVAV